MKKALSTILALILAISMMPLSALAYDGELAGIEYTPREPIFLYYEMDGYFDNDSKGEEYFRYNVVQYGAGDVLTLIDVNGDRTDYTGRYNDDTDEYEYASADGDVIFGDDVNIYEEQYNEHYTLGSENYMYVSYSGFTASVPVTVLENPVSAATFIPAQDYVIVEHTNGEWCEDEDGEYYSYYTPDYNQGDVIRVTYTDDRGTVDYTYDKDDWEFYDENGEVLPDEDELSKWKYSRADWTIGSDENLFFVEYKGYRTPVNVTIIENPVSGVRFTRANDLVLTEGVGQYYDNGDERYYFHTPYFESGDVLTVTDNKGNTTEYVYGYDENKGENVFAAANGETIAEEDVYIYTRQQDTPWIIGSENEYYVEYAGYTVTLKATVIANPVSAFEYVPAQEKVIIENTEGYESDGVWRYYTPYFEKGDKLYVYDSEGNEKIYTYTNVGYDPGAFVATDGDVIEDVRTSSDQYETPWSIGENEYYIEYAGYRVPATVTIKENNVSAIRIEKVNEPVIFANDYETVHEYGMEFKLYPLPTFEEGDKLIVTDKEGNDTEYVLTFDENDGERYFVNGEDRIGQYEVFCSSDQFFNPWQVGENTYYAEYSGQSCALTVRIIESDIKSISYTPKTPRVFDEYQGGELVEDDGRSYYRYNVMMFDTGDTLTVTYQSGETDVFEVKFDEERDEPYLENANGDIITGAEIDIYERQYEQPWTAGGQNYVYVKYKGAICEIPVTVNHTYTTAVTAPTCTAKGYTTHTCSACGDTYKDSYVNALGHKWNAGVVTKKATPTATGVKTYTCTVCGAKKTETIAKCAKYANPITVKAKKPTVKFSALKKKNQTITAKNAVTVSKAQGKVTYKKSSGNSKITVASNGKITVKKGLKKGTYKVKIKVTAAGNATYKSGSKTVTVTIKVK